MGVVRGCLVATKDACAHATPSSPPNLAHKEQYSTTLLHQAMPLWLPPEMPLENQSQTHIPLGKRHACCERSVFQLFFFIGARIFCDDIFSERNNKRAKCIIKSKEQYIVRIIDNVCLLLCRINNHKISGTVTITFCCTPTHRIASMKNVTLRVPHFKFYK